MDKHTKPGADAAEVERIRAWMEAENLTGSDLARELDMQPNTLLVIFLRKRLTDGFRWRLERRFPAQARELLRTPHEFLPERLRLPFP